MIWMTMPTIIRDDDNVDDDNDNDNDDDNCWVFLSAIARENSYFRLKKGHEMLPSC